MQVLAVEARTAHDRFGQTYSVMLRVRGNISKTIAVARVTPLFAPSHLLLRYEMNQCRDKLGDLPNRE